MRVIAGTHRGRRIAAPPGTGTRPTSDRVREGIFSRLDALGLPSGCIVLDLFAGSGALGIEALSRGATEVTFVENDRRALRSLRSNLETLGLTGRSHVLARDAIEAVERPVIPGAPFTLLFLDPPYRIDKSEVRGALGRMIASGVLAPGTMLVWEHGAASAPEWPGALQDLGGRRYGDTMVSMARSMGGET